MINRVRVFKIIASAFATVIMVGGIMLLWVNNSSEAVFADSRAIYKGTSQNNVAIMINVYTGTEYLDSILASFANFGAKATFFVGGCWAEKNEEKLKSLSLGGHEIGSHGYFHKDHSKLSYNANLEEMNITHKMIKAILGVDIELFAPPSGAYSVATLDAAENMNYKTILWSKDTIDWRDHDAELIYTRATKDLVGGDLILMHPTEKTAEALPRVLQEMQNKGFVPTTVTNTL